MKTAYVYSDPEGLVKIVEHNGSYDVYRLERVTAYKKPSRCMDMRCSPSTTFNNSCGSCAGGAGGVKCSLRLAFSFSARPVKTWSYKPYEDADVSGSPNQFFGLVKRMSPHLIDHA